MQNTISHIWRLKNYLPFVVVIVILLSATLPAGQQPATAGDGGPKKFDLSELPSKGNPRLDATLNRMVVERGKPEDGPSMSRHAMQAEETVRVVVQAVPGQSAGVMAAAAGLGNIEASYGNLVQINVPVSSLEALAALPGARYVRLPMRPLPAAISEGVELISADDWQTAGYNGTGVKIGILDGGFYGYTALQGTDLPASVSTWWAPTYGNEGTSPHGTACAEIVYDIAPAADYYYANCYSLVEYSAAVDWMISQGVDIISCSLGWPAAGLGDGSGPACDVINKAKSAGILWAQSAGNQAMRHWQGDFTDTNPDDDFHEFSGSDWTNEIYAYYNQNIYAALRWDDSWGASGNDYDLWLFDQNYTPITQNISYTMHTQDGDDEPWEQLAYTANYTGYYHIVIYRYSAPESVNFHLYSAYQDFQYQTAIGSLVIPADSPNAMSVGAVFWNAPGTLESFSSWGPTDNAVVKPDIVAPDGVSTVSRGPSDGNDFLSYGTGFFGTSASAPHVAGAAALAKERYPSYSDVYIRSFLESRAVDLGSAGKDNQYGSGRLDLGSPGYTLTMAVSGNGTTSPATGNHTYDNGDVVAITATAAPGWAFVNWTGDVATVADIYLASTNITMNGDYSITANFVPEVTLTMAVSGNGTTIPATGSHTYLEGDIVAITAVADPGWAFSNWSGDVSTVDDVNSATTNITMNGTYSITANFVQEVNLTIAVSGNGTVTPAIGSHEYDIGEVVDITAIPDLFWDFVNWTGDTGTIADVDSAATNITMDADYSITANFTPHICTLTMVVSGNGTITPPVGDHDYPWGTVVDITAVPDPGWRFINWTGEFNNIWDVNSSTTNITVEGSYIVIANFGPEVTLTMAVNGNGTTVPAVGSHIYPEGKELEITAIPDPGWSFSNWSGNATGSENPKTINIVDDMSITANFTQPLYTLTMAVSGNGTVTPAVGSHTYDLGEIVDIMATADPGWRFLNWTGDVSTIDDVNSANTNITMNDDYTIQANFSEPMLSISVNGSGTTIPSTGSYVYTEGTIVEITAIPGANWEFANWTGDVNTVDDVNSAATNITMDDNYSITANFNRIQSTLNINVIGNGSINPVSGNYTYPIGTVVTISAAPASGWQFSAWTGDVGTVDDVNSATTTVAMDGDYYINANFIQNMEKIVFFSYRDNAYPEIYSMNPDGSNQQRLTNNLTNDFHPSLSPDCSRIAFVSTRYGGEEICVMDVDGSNVVRLTNNSKWDNEPAWSPDNNRIAFESNRDGGLDIYIMDADGSNVTRVTTNGGGRPVWSPDGTQIAFIAGSPANVYIINADGTGRTRITDEQPGYIYGISWSPDGSRIAYDLIEPYNPTPGVPDYYSHGINIINVDGTGKVTLPETGALDDAAWPVWSPDGTQIAFATTRHPPIEIYVVNVEGSNIVRLTNNNVDDVCPSWASNVSQVPSSPPPSNPPPGDMGTTGGGSGGGGSRGITSFGEIMNPEGELMADVTAASSDLQVYITMSDGTQPRGGNSGVIYWVSVKAVPEGEIVPEPPEGAIPVSPCYEMEPDGATFDPPVSGTFSYKLWGLPEGVDVNNLVVMWYDEATGQWVPVAGVIDPVNMTVTIRMSHFSLYRLMVMNRPADISIIEMTVEPAEITAGGDVIVSALVCNHGDCAGDFEAVLMVNDVVYGTQELSVNGGEEVPVSFELTGLEPGTYFVELGGQTLEFTVPGAGEDDFTVTSLEISPVEVDPGEEVTISVMVNNTGDLPGDYEVVLKIDGEIIENREVTLDGGISQEVVFSTTLDTAGKHIIEVDRAIGSLNVRGEVPPAEHIPLPLEEKEPETEVIPEPVSEPDTPDITETTGALPEEPSTNWGLIGGIIVAVVVLGAAGYFLWWRKRGESEQPPAQET